MIEIINNQYSLLLLSMLSAKIWDLAYIILLSIMNAILWENRIYTTNVENTSEFFRILKKISKTYYICSETRFQYESQMMLPSGFVIGPYYIAHVKSNVNDMNNHTSSTTQSSIRINIHIYGWFSIRSLITPDIESNPRGKYNIIESGTYTSYFHEYAEHFPEEFFHRNACIASQIIYESVMKQHNRSGVYLLYGIPNTGKSTTAKRLFDYFGESSALCYDLLNPPGNVHTLQKGMMVFYNKIKPENDKFLLFVLDEVDEIIDNIFKKKDYDRYNPKFPTKQSWNSFLEKVSTLNNTVLILTTNKSKDYFDSLDNSLFREHRVTKSFRYDHDGVTEDTFLTDDKSISSVSTSTITATATATTEPCKKEEAPLKKRRLDRIRQYLGL